MENIYGGNIFAVRTAVDGLTLLRPCVAAIGVGLHVVLTA